MNPLALMLLATMPAPRMRGEGYRPDPDKAPDNPTPPPSGSEVKPAKHFLAAIAPEPTPKAPRQRQGKRKRSRKKRGW